MTEWRIQVSFEHRLDTALVIADLVDCVIAAGLQVDRIDDLEPVRREYDRAEVSALFDEGQERGGVAGSLILVGPSILGGLRYVVGGPRRTTTNVLSIRLRHPDDGCVRGLPSLLEALDEVSPIAAAILGEASDIDAQHVTGTVESRLPGISWCNMFGRIHVAAIGRDVLESAPWARIATRPDGGRIGYLYDDPSAPPRDLDARRTLVRSHLGEEKFQRDRWRSIPPIGLPSDWDDSVDVVPPRPLPSPSDGERHREAIALADAATHRMVRDGTREQQASPMSARSSTGSDRRLNIPGSPRRSRSSVESSAHCWERRCGDSSAGTGPPSTSRVTPRWSWPGGS